jgi:hypothetical protein
VAIDPVLIRFAAHGVQDVDRAFATIAQRMARAELEGARFATEGSAKRVRTARTETDARSKEYARAVREIEKWEREATRAAEKEIRAREQASKRAASEELRELERVERQKMAIRIRSSEMAGRLAEQQARAEAEANRKVSRAYGGAFKSGISGGLGIARTAAGAMSIGGGFLIADAAHEELRAQKQAALLVSLGTVGGKAGASLSEVLGASGKAALAGGMSRDDVQRGALAYSQNARGGDTKGAMALMPFFAKMAKVTGADIGEIGAGAGTLQSQNPNLHADEMKQMLLSAFAQSKAGSMSFADAIKQVGVLGSTRSYYTGDAAANQRTLIGLGQIARTGGDVGEAGTFVKDIATEAGEANKKFRKTHGGKDLLHVTKEGLLDSPEKVVEQVLRGTGGNLMQINHLFGQRGSRLFGELAGTYQAAAKGKTGKAAEDAGVAAALGNVREITGASMSEGELDEQHRAIMGNSAEKLDESLNRVKISLGEHLEPVLEKLAGVVERSGDNFEKLAVGALKVAEIFLDHPWAGLGTIVAGKIVAELAKAGIAEEIKRALGAAGGGAGPGGGAVGALGRAGAVVGAGLGGAAVAMVATDYVAETDSETQRKQIGNSLASTNTVLSLADKVRTGTVTPADIEAAKGERGALEQQKKDAQGGPGFGAYAMASLDFTPGGSDEVMAAARARKAAEEKTATESLAALNKMIDVATKSLQKLGAQAGAVDPSRHAPLTGGARAGGASK